MNVRGLKHPGRWIWLLLLVPALIGLARLKFDTEIFNLLPGDLTVVRGLRAYQDHFAAAREAIVTIRANDAGQAEAAARVLAEAFRLETNLVAGATWQPPWLEHPEQAAELIAYIWLNQPPALFADLTNRLSPPNLGPLVEAARESLATSFSPGDIARFSYDPFGLTQLPDSASGATPSFAEGQEGFASADGTFRVVFVKAARELASYRECQDWLTALRARAGLALASAPETASPGIELRFTGRPVFVAEAAAEMRSDVTSSVGGTSLIIALLFWFAHRRLKPLLWLLALLGMVLAATLAMGGFVYGEINVISLGFAAILLGLAVDYGLVHYQEAMAHPEMSIPVIRRMIAPSISWAALTTIAAFLVLNLGGLPGLAQLGTLVAMGVTIGALAMVFEYLPPLFPGRNRIEQSSARVKEQQPDHASAKPPDAQPRTRSGLGRLHMGTALALTAALLVTAAVVLSFGLPRIDATGNALRPRQSEAYATMEKVRLLLTQGRDPLWLIATGPDEETLKRRLEAMAPLLRQAQTNGLTDSFTLPTALLPDRSHQKANSAAARGLTERLPLFREAARSGGFTDRSLGLLERVLKIWEAAGPSGFLQPTNEMSRWILEKVVARTTTNFLALGLVQPSQQAPPPTALAGLERALLEQGAYLSGWELLGRSVYERVRLNFWKVLGPMLGLVLLTLWLAFRRMPELLLSLAVLGTSILVLMAAMRLLGWSWNLMNLLAAPLVLGTGVDYGIFIQLALRRYDGNWSMVWRSVCRALLLCGGTTIAAFGSLAWSNNSGMASFGQVCALGVACNLGVAIFLLPAWWQSLLGRPTAKAGVPPSPPATPSAFYRAGLWRLGLGLARSLPTPVFRAIAQMLTTIYWALAPHRRRVVAENLLPALADQRPAADRATRRLFRHFGVKIADLLRFEAGLPVGHMFGRSVGWERYIEARQRGKGVLLLTVHLGNWEFGAHCVTEAGHELQVLSLAEPGPDFTELRQASRSRRKVETIVIRNDPFAFVDIIRRLESGTTVALLMDRPPPQTAVEVELFKRPFAASIAAAELARASGCELVPTYIVWEGANYGAYILPAIPYERQALRNRDARRDLTQRIISAFEPAIREHIDQWYHFVPAWPSNEGKPK